MRLQPDQLAQLDRWISVLPDPKPTRPEAIRRVLDAVTCITEANQVVRRRPKPAASQYQPETPSRW